eukprot:6205380-Pleurochrysis_carterae.AAC.5
MKEQLQGQRAAQESHSSENHLGGTGGETCFRASQLTMNLPVNLVPSAMLDESEVATRDLTVKRNGTRSPPGSCAGEIQMGVRKSCSRVA